MERQDMLDEQMTAFVTETVHNIINLNDAEEIRLTGAELLAGSCGWMRHDFKQKFMANAINYVDARIDKGPASEESYQELMALAFVLLAMNK